MNHLDGQRFRKCPIRAQIRQQFSCEGVCRYGKDQKGSQTGKGFCSLGLQ